MANEQNVEDIRETAAQEFLKESSGWQVDTTALPSIRRRIETKSKSGDGFTDERFTPAPQKEKSPALYRKDLVRFVNKNAGDPEVGRILRDGGVQDNSSDGQAGTVYVTVRASGEEVPVDVRYKDGLWVAYTRGTKYSAETRDGLLSAVSRGLNQDARELTSDELREISILCSRYDGGFYRAVARFVSLVTGLTEDEALSDAALLNPRHAAAYDRAVSFCYLACSPDFAPSDDWPRFLLNYANGRHLSAALCNGARVAYEVEKQSAARESILSQVDSPPAQPEEAPAPTYKQLDELGDDELQQQFRSVRKEHAKLVRAGIL